MASALLTTAERHFSRGELAQSEWGVPPPPAAARRCGVVDGSLCADDLQPAGGRAAHSASGSTPKGRGGVAVRGELNVQSECAVRGEPVASLFGDWQSRC